MSDVHEGGPAGLTGRHMSRRTLLKTSGVFGAGFGLASLLSACGVADGGSDGASSSSAPKQGGTLTLGIDGTSAVVDPAYYSTIGDWMAVDSVCRGLTFISFTDTTVQPDLAESWDISDDQLTYTFHLRSGVTFHDGTTFTSADVLASLNRQIDADDKTLPEGSAQPLAINTNVASLTAPDDSTVVLTLKAVDGTALAALSDIGGRILSKAALDKYGADIGKNPVGTGPFKFVSATSGQSVTLEAFDGYRSGRPPIDRLVLQQVQDSSTIVSSLLSGDLSATQFTPYSAIDQLKADDSVTVYDTAKGFDAMLLMDARKPALAELEVRQAINLAIDRDAIVAQAFFGVAALPKGYAIPPAVPGYDESLADLSVLNVDQAKQLLSSVGATGRTVHLLYASDSWHPRAAQLIEQNLTDIGLKVVSESVDPATYFSRLLDPSDDAHELMIWERNIYVPDASNMVRDMADPTSIYAGAITGMSTLDGADDFAQLGTDAANMAAGDERTAAWTSIQRRWAQDYMVISMLAAATNLVVSGADVQGMNVDALANHRCFMESASV